MGSHTSAAGAEIRAVLDGVRRIVQNLRESSRWAEKNLGMSGAQLFVLQKLAESPAQSVNALASRTHTHQSSVSTIVARLVAAGLIIRRRSASDARAVELDVTARGRRVVSRAPDAAQERLIDGITRLSPTRRRALASALSALGRAMDADHDPVMFFEDGTRRPRARRSAHA
jgi:DNA-binding MarR family transcriptional regulator